MPFMVISASDTNNVNLNAKADELRGWHQIGCYRMTTFDYKIATILKWFKWYAPSKIDNEYHKGVLTI